ncbi:PIG-L family deacetylase [Plantactinospora siamensis]|uniref:PIG-L family deacetylase n=1 Tax=Plantactinospora siamensis TaxID=555372 RepID=A0ABV6NYA1_9ACTN
MPSAPSVLCVHAHPDDEALWTGGLLLRAAARGWSTAVLTCAAEPGGPRVAELAESLAVLGAEPPRLLGYGDSGHRADAGPGSLCGADLDEVTDRLTGELRRSRPDVVVTYDAGGGYGHPDHVRTHRATLAAVEAAAHPAVLPSAGPPWRVRTLLLVTWPRTAVERVVRALATAGVVLPPLQRGMGVSDDAIDVALDVRPWQEAKWRALRSHRSQLARGHGPANVLALSAPDRTLLLGTEWYQRRELSRRPDRCDRDGPDDDEWPAPLADGITPAAPARPVRSA